MYQLHMSYDTIINTSWETLEWIYNRHVQQLVDIQKEQEKANNKFI